MLSIIIPILDEAASLPQLLRELDRVAIAESYKLQMILVDDGSTDCSWTAICQAAAEDPRILGIRFRRNFGKARALSHGFAAANGSAIVTMDGDLQDDPDEMPRFIETLNNGYDLAAGWKQRRQDPLGKTAPSKLFNLTVRKVTGVQLHDFNFGFKAYRRDAAKSIREIAERLSRLADDLDKRTASVADGINDLTSSTTKQVNAVSRDLQRTLSIIDRTVNNIDRNPSRLLFGGGSGGAQPQSPR